MRYNDTICIQGDPELTSLSTLRRSSNVAEKTLTNTSTVEHEHDMSFPTVKPRGPTTRDQNQQTTPPNPISQPNTERRLNPICQPTHGNSEHHLPNLFLDQRNSTQYLYTALSWRSLPLCPRHNTKTHRSSDSEQLLPMQVNRSVVFTCIGVSLYAV